MSKVKLLELAMVQHHASPPDNFLLPKCLTQIHHMRPQLLPLRVIADLVKLHLGLIPEIDISLGLFPELLELILKFLLLASHLVFELIELRVKILLNLIDEGASDDPGGLIVSQRRVDMNTHIGRVDVEVTPGLKLLILRRSSRAVLLVRVGHGLGVSEGVLVKARGWKILIMHTLEALPVERSFPRLI